MLYRLDNRGAGLRKPLPPENLRNVGGSPVFRRLSLGSIPPPHPPPYPNNRIFTVAWTICETVFCFGTISELRDVIPEVMDAGHPSAGECKKKVYTPCRCSERTGT